MYSALPQLLLDPEVKVVGQSASDKPNPLLWAFVSIH